MKVVSVVNYKGGVGKTTLTANLGAGLAARGNQVLLIDLDPQASLTFSFFTQVEWREHLAPERTIKKWYDSPSRGKAVTKLSDLIVTPVRVNQTLGDRGQIDMVASHQDLVTIDALLYDAIDKKTGDVTAGRFVQVFRRLAEGLAHPSFAGYGYVLIDCPPNFHMMTKNAIVASDFMLIPTRPDYLSINGINHLGGRLFGFINDYNVHARRSPKKQVINGPREAVVFNMVNIHGGGPIDAQSVNMSKVRALGAPVFRTFIRDRRTIYPVAPETGVPAVLQSNEAAGETSQLIDDFLKWTEGTPL